MSGREKMIKPDADIYQLCLSRNNLNPIETVFIDDNLENAHAASNLGITGIHFTNPEKLHADLTNLGINI